MPLLTSSGVVASHSCLDLHRTQAIHGSKDGWSPWATDAARHQASGGGHRGQAAGGAGIDKHDVQQLADEFPMFSSREVAIYLAVHIMNKRGTLYLSTLARGFAGEGRLNLTLDPDAFRGKPGAVARGKLYTSAIIEVVDKKSAEVRLWCHVSAGGKTVLMVGRSLPSLSYQGGRATVKSILATVNKILKSWNVEPDNGLVSSRLIGILERR